VHPDWIIDRLCTLERAAGSEVHYRIYSPASNDFSNYATLQRTAREIAEFAGLHDTTFVVALTTLDKGTHGNVEFSSGSHEAFIEVDAALTRFPEAVIATLCHEVCHKWLEKHGLAMPDTVSNEMLTDIAAVFLGFGQVMMKGCRSQRIHSERSANGDHLKTYKQETGYLDRDELALTYSIVCEMRRIPMEDRNEGLGADLAQTVKACDKAFGHHYSSRFHDDDQASEVLVPLVREMRKSQLLLAELDKHTTYILKSFVEPLRASIVNLHQGLDLIHSAARDVTDGDHNSVLRFLRAARRDRELQRLRDQLDEIRSQCYQMLGDATHVSRDLGSRRRKPFTPPSPGMFCIVTCPKDGTTLRLPKNSGDLVATCPKCQYRFAYNTAPDLIGMRGLLPLWWQTCWHRCRGFMRRHWR